MKRVQYACLEQTIHFMLKDNLVHASAAKEVQAEVASYKAQLDRGNTKYKIIEERMQPDDSVILKIKKQYNNYKCGNYLD